MDNNAAADIDMSKDSNKWVALMKDGKPIRVNAEDGGLKFTTEESGMDYDGCEWGDAEFEFLSQQRGRHVLLQCIRHHSILHGPRQSDNSIPNVGTSVRQQPDFGRVERLKPYFH